MTVVRPRHAIAPKTYLWRRLLVVALAFAMAATVFLGYSLGTFLVNPAYGNSLSARVAEWAREHGGGSIVTSIETWWYTNHPPPKGGKPPAGAITSNTSTVLQSGTNGALPIPPTVVSPASPALPGEGVWHQVGRSVDGEPAVLSTTVRVDAVHTSQVAAIAWIDTALVEASLYSGSFIPGGGPFHHTAPISASAAKTVVAAFNSGFRMQDAQGGYYTDGHVLPGLPLRTGAASYVIDADGSSTVGMWGRDVTMTPSVVAVRQNLDLIVDGGKPVAGLDASDSTKWGKTLGGGVYVWRSGLGVTADGALVYVGGPSLSIVSLADLLVRAGAVRGMETDINTDWVQFSTFNYGPHGKANGSNGTSLLPGMTSTPARYFDSWFNRDFVVLQARPAATTTTTTVG